MEQQQAGIYYGSEQELTEIVKAIQDFYLSSLSELRKKYPGLRLAISVSDIQVYHQKDFKGITDITVDESTYGCGLLNPGTLIILSDATDKLLNPIIRIKLNR